MRRMMSIPVRTPHATSSPNIGDICHLGAEIEPIPRSGILLPSENLVVSADVRVTAPTADDYRPVGKLAPRLLSGLRHLMGRFGKRYALGKSLAELVSSFVIIRATRR